MKKLEVAKIVVTGVVGFGISHVVGNAVAKVSKEEDKDVMDKALSMAGKWGISLAVTEIAQPVIHLRVDKTASWLVKTFTK